MFASIGDDIKNAWTKSGNSLQRIIIINIGVFLVVRILDMFNENAASILFQDFLAIPTDLQRFVFRPWTFITSFFTHFDFSHILWNMLFLYWFGRLIKNFVGDAKIVPVFVLGGIAGSISVLILFNLVPSFSNEAGGIAFGASAGVFAVSMAAATFFPNYSFNLLFLGPVKIKYIVAVQVFVAVIGLNGANVGGEVAHLAGALVGYFYVKELRKGNDIGAWVLDTISFFQNIFTKKAKMKVNRSESRKSSGRPSSEKTSEAPSQAEIDAILDKIADRGYESLSKLEKEKLFNAGKK